VKYNIKFARFLNEYRNNLPDIDLDFPHNIRDEVFVKIQLKWPNKVARISNHVYFHEKSALRQAFRNVGIRKFIGKNEIQKELDKQKKDVKKKIIDEKKKLENTFRCYSLHCGGIVYFSEGIPQKLLLNKDKYNNKNNLIPQITLNKYDIAKEKNFKIDILSSRALSQCYEINQYNSINFEEFKYDKKTFDMLSNGDNLGIILGESPLIRKAFMKIKPKNLYDIAVCLSIIRPAAKDARKSIEIGGIQRIFDAQDTARLSSAQVLQKPGELNESIIFDDDAIDMIANEFKISDAEADKYRRGFTKGSSEVINEFRKLLKDLPRERQRLTMQKFANLSRYGFCKSHALSYAQLIYKLAYLKANKPLEFWKGTLNNCVSSYKKWVHLYEAKIAGVDLSNIHNNKDVSIYALNRKNKINNLTLKEQLGKYGYWNITNDDFFPGCFLNIKNNVYEFNGIIASHRLIRFNKEKKLMLFIGVEKKKYIQLNISNVKFFNNKFIGISGKGSPSDLLNKECSIIDVSEYKFY
jgi:DNA polymerase-3 subunit alpha